MYRIISFYHLSIKRNWKFEVIELGIQKLPDWHFASFNPKVNALHNGYLNCWLGHLCNGCILKLINNIVYYITIIFTIVLLFK